MDNNGIHINKSNVSLADSDGWVLGGGVVGSLVAATPVQVRLYVIVFLFCFGCAQGVNCFNHCFLLEVVVGGFIAENQQNQNPLRPHP